MSKLNISQNSRMFRLGLALTFGLVLLIGLLLAMGATRSPDVALAQGPTTRYVAPAPTGNDSGNDCITSSTPCATVQHAVDVADSGDEIRVAAGTYTDVQSRGGITQVVYISKTVTIRGGYTTTNWTTPYPVTQPTTLDAQGQGRVLYIIGNISPTINGFIITGGHTSGDGGGIAVYNGSPMLSHNTITNNHATNYGGGIYVIGSAASPMLNSNHIISNTTSNNGGGIFIDDYSSPILVNNAIARNRASSNGGGIYIDFRSAPSIINNTIVANNLGPSWANEGIFMYNTPSPTIVNNIIVSHSYGIRYGGISCDDTPPVTITLDYNDVWACSIICYCGVITGTHDICDDPRFVDPDGGDYHLRPDSPCIDKGTDESAPETDWEEDPRPLDGDEDGTAVTDMGADEFKLYQICLPIIFKNSNP